MGKSKKRILNKTTDLTGSVLKREEIIEQIISDIKSNNISDKVKNFIGLFGITIEELSEAGASYEELSMIKHFI
ncbi:MAG: hypothetical protein LUH05_05715 [Candidatus Gastranaerophilales bacterium]|nr:hypothetical protein [Candidatus Gastranaerophilales bacterium]